jgi:hypothetical protein
MWRRRVRAGSEQDDDATARVIIAAYLHDLAVTAADFGVMARTSPLL